MADNFVPIEAKAAVIKNTSVFFQKTVGGAGAVVGNEVYHGVEEVRDKIASLKLKRDKIQDKIDILEALLLEDGFSKQADTTNG